MSSPTAAASSLPLSVVVITLNEERNLARCLGSVRGLSRDMVIVDSGSTDATRAIAESFGARVVVQPWLGNLAQKNAALRLAAERWALCLDADEWLSPELADSVRRLFADGEPREEGFFVNRLNAYVGVWIRHSWNPEWRLRLARTDRAEWRGFDPHGRIHVAGPTARLGGNLLHESFVDLTDHFRKTVEYGRTSANAYARSGRTCRWYHLVVSPWAALLKHLVIKQGWRDGWRGWIIAYAAFMGVFVKYALLAEQSHLRPTEDGRDG